MTQSTRTWLAGCTLVLAWLLPTTAVQAAASVLIWPLDPTIEAGERGTALWLENVGTDAVTVQIRILGWNQQNSRDDYVAQQSIIGTPPFTTIPAGKKQLIRLTLTQPVEAGQEQAFRVLIDEIPSAHAAGTATTPPQATAGLRFQMRYSLPLFAYGTGLSGKPINRPATRPAQPQLSWNIEQIDGKPYLRVHNAGSGHARLSQVRLTAASAEGAEAAPLQTDIVDGLLGYVLPGQTMRWPLPMELPARDYNLQAQLVANSEAVTLARQ